MATEVAPIGALIEEIRFADDSPVEGEGFELSVPGQRISRLSRNPLGCLRGIGTPERTSRVQAGFVKIMPLPPEASGALFCYSPVDPEDDERDQVLQSERYVWLNHTNIWNGQERRDHGKFVDALWVGK